MTLFNLTTLFGITPSNTPALTKSVNFKGSEYSFGFNFEEQEPYQDSFTTNPIGANFTNKAAIEQLAKSNPRIMAILKEHNIPLRVNMDVLEEMR